MIKKCQVCNHTGELTWRDGKYYCTICGSEVSEYAPQVQPQTNTVVSNAICPICKNHENNLFDGARYRCALCETQFDLQQVTQTSSFNYTSANISTQHVQDLHKKKEKNLIWGIVFVFLFWPVSIYFFYKYYKFDKELKAIGQL